jgi:hypothetical protein
MADNQLVQPPDFHPSEPQLGVLYPEGPSPVQELPDPRPLPPPQPNQSADFSIADTLSKNDFQSVASKTFDPVSVNPFTTLFFSLILFLAL